MGLAGRIEAALSFSSDLSTGAILAWGIWINTGRLLLAQANDIRLKLDVYIIPTCPSRLQ
jgi:hypothetical protein